MTTGLLHIPETEQLEKKFGFGIKNEKFDFLLFRILYGNSKYAKYSSPLFNLQECVSHI
jgi:hypothetical protein